MTAILKVVFGLALGLLAAAALAYAAIGTVGLAKAILTSGGSWDQFVVNLDHFAGVHVDFDESGTHFYLSSRYPVLQYVGVLVLSWAVAVIFALAVKRLVRHQRPRTAA